MVNSQAINLKRGRKYHGVPCTFLLHAAIILRTTFAQKHKVTLTPSIDVAISRVFAAKKA